MTELGGVWVDMTEVVAMEPTPSGTSDVPSAMLFLRGGAVLFIGRPFTEVVETVRALRRVGS